jgi:hypothetical protein
MWKLFIIVGRVGRVRRVRRVRPRNGNCLRTVDVKPSILRTRLVLSKIIRRQKFTETAEENKVEQAIVRYVLVMLEELEELEELEGLYA